MELSGASGAELCGTAKRQFVDASGGSRYEASGLQSRSADIEGGGGSLAVVWATEELQADLSGGSNVSDEGTPTVTQTTSGGSVVAAR